MILTTNAKTKSYCNWERKMKSKIRDQQKQQHHLSYSERNGNGWNESIHNTQCMKERVLWMCASQPLPLYGA